MIDLQKFCSSDPTRTNINKPFSRGDFTYATNGHILVRVPRMESIGEQEISDKVKPVEPEPIFAAIKDYRSFHPIPDIPPPVTKPCFKCSGTGKVNICPECDGDGEVHFSNRHNNYDCECESCGGDGFMANGKGEPETCKGCGGEGKITEKSYSKTSGRYYDNLYLSWLEDLPECLLAEAEGMEPGYFKFTGGDGLIMPVNMKDEQFLEIKTAGKPEYKLGRG